MNLPFSPPALGRVIRKSVGLFAAVCLALNVVSPAGAQEKPPQLANTFLQLSVTAASGDFVIRDRATNPTWSLAGHLATGGGTARTRPVADPAFGAGDMIEVTRADGVASRLIVFPSLPFVLVQGMLKNAGREPQVLNRVPLATVVADLGTPASALTTLGSGGLLPADNNPGSYIWLAVADPQSRRGAVAAWLTHDRASGVLFSKSADKGVAIEARADYGRLLLAPGATADTEKLALGGFADTHLGLEAWADAVAKHYAIKLPPQPTGYCTWYSDKNRGAGSEKSLPELAAFAAAKLRPYGFNFIQIDDGWQEGDAKGPKDKKNGPHKNFTQHRATGPYPAGMKATAERITALGFTAGLWFMPFAGTFDDPWFADKQHWFVKRADGTPFDMPWGGTALDMSHPEARAYVRSLSTRIAREWGYRYFKMDGIYTGIAANPRYVNAGYKEDELGDAVFSRPELTNTEVYRSGFKLIREAAGPDVFFLGCTMSQNMRTFGASFGLVDAMRVGPDNGANFKAWTRSPVCGSRHYFLHGRVWYNDPDPMYARAGIPDEDARTIATWTGISGQLYANSDWLPDLPAARLELIRRTIPPHGATARPVDLLERDPATVWQVTDARGAARRDVVAVFNWGDAPAAPAVEFARLDLPPAPRYAAFDFWANRFLPPVAGQLTGALPAHGCRVVALRPMLDRPFVVSTSRHVTQGMTDLREERWDSAARTLGGRSEVIAGDGYELRIVMPDAPHAWRAAAIELDAAAKAAGASARLVPDGANLRVRIDTPQTCEVSWRLRCE